MSETSFCWQCGRPLVGKNGSKKPPLIFRIVEIQPGQEVRVHVSCEQYARDSIKGINAQPSERGTYHE